MFEGLFQPMQLMFLAGLAALVFGLEETAGNSAKDSSESIRGFKAGIAGKDAASTPVGTEK